MPHGGECDSAPRADATPYPPLMKVAGLIWLMVGGLDVLHTAAWYVLVGEIRIVGVPIGCCPSGPAASWCTGLVGLPYMLAGFRTLTGRTNDPQAFGVFSIVLGMLQIVASMVYGTAGMNAQHERVPGALLALSAVTGLSGTALFIAGVLALIDRSIYKEWLRARRIARIRD